MSFFKNFRGMVGDDEDYKNQGCHPAECPPMPEEDECAPDYGCNPNWSECYPDYGYDCKPEGCLCNPADWLG